MSENGEWVHSWMRREVGKSREAHKSDLLAERRFKGDSGEDEDESEWNKNPSVVLAKIVQSLKTSKFQDKKLLTKLKIYLSETEGVAANEFFRLDNALHSLVGVLTGHDVQLQVLSSQIIANLAPLKEKNGMQLARAAGPYLITFLSSSCVQLQEASAVALGNLAVGGAKVVKIIVNQEGIESLSHVIPNSNETVQAACFYALYHIVRNGQNIEKNLLEKVADLGPTFLCSKCPMELPWVLFSLSCNDQLHHKLACDTIIFKCLDICTYEIYQKADSRPLVKIVTPIIRLLSNVCAGPMSEMACLMLLKHPDLPAILMALLGTNYTHLCKETLWLFSNVVNNESVVVQEEFIELDLMDKLEYHTIQAVQKLDPYAVT